MQAPPERRCAPLPPGGERLGAARRPEDYATMLAALTPASIAALFGDWVKGPVEGYPMPNIDGCLVLLVHGLGGGATRTLRFDQTAKALGNAILRLPLPA